MARVLIPVNELSYNTALELTTVDVNATDNHYIDVDDLDDCVLYVTNTTGSDKAVTIKAGVTPPALRASIGDLAETVTNGEARYFRLESARFLQVDGTVNVNLASGYSGGKLAVIKLVRG